MMNFQDVTVGQVMTTQVFFVAPDTTFDKVREIFSSHEFHHLPVLDKGSLVGMISKSDLLLLSNAFPLDDPARRRERDEELLSRILVKEVMTIQLVRLRPDMPIPVAVGIFLENIFHAMPVVDEEGELVGILSWIDLLRLAYVPRQNLSNHG
jgi:acetoin utilization protein AcuB